MKTETGILNLMFTKYMRRIIVPGLIIILKLENKAIDTDFRKIDLRLIMILEWIFKRVKIREIYKTSS